MKRNLSIDIIKVSAVILTIAFHFTVHTRFLNTRLINPQMFLQLLVRYFTTICVPLFYLATGYLKGTTKSRKLSKLIPILCSYFIISIILLILNITYFHKDIPLLEWGISLLSFIAHPYCGFIAVYILLFIAIPYLNTLYQNLTQKQKQHLLIFLIIVTFLPNFFANFQINNITLNIIPSIFTSLYAITYYFIGAYLKEYPIKWKKWKIFTVLFITLLYITTYCWFQRYCLLYDPMLFAGPNDITIAIMSVCFFLLILKPTTKEKKESKVLPKIASMSFEIILFSYLFEIIIYPPIRSKIYQIDMLPYILIIVPSIFLLSLLSAFLYTTIFKYLKKKIQLVFSRRKREYHSLRNGC